MERAATGARARRVTLLVPVPEPLVQRKADLARGFVHVWVVCVDAILHRAELTSRRHAHNEALLDKCV